MPSQSVLPCALTDDARHSWVQASCTHPSVSLCFLKITTNSCSLDCIIQSVLYQSCVFLVYLKDTAPTPCPDSAQKRRCCWQDSWEDTLAKTPLLFRHFVTQLGHVLRSQVPPRCLKAPGQRNLAPNLCTQVSLGPLRFSLGTSAPCLPAPALAVQLPAGPKGTNACQTETFHSVLVTCLEMVFLMKKTPSVL